MNIKGFWKKIKEDWKKQNKYFSKQKAELIFATVICMILFVIIFALGYTWISKMTLIILSFLFIYTIVAFHTSNEKYWKILLYFLGIFIAFIAMQSQTPLFFPKISMTMTDNLMYGWIEETTRYADQYILIEIYPPLFPIQFINCQEIPIGYNIIEFKPKKTVLPAKLTLTNNNSISVCVNYADAWMWESITIDAYLRSQQVIRYNISSGQEIELLLQNYDVNANQVLYRTIYIHNLENFKVSYNYMALYFLNGTDAYIEFMELRESECEDSKVRIFATKEGLGSFNPNNYVAGLTELPAPKGAGVFSVGV